MLIISHSTFQMLRCMPIVRCNFKWFFEKRKWQIFLSCCICSERETKHYSILLCTFEIISATNCNWTRDRIARLETFTRFECLIRISGECCIKVANQREEQNAQNKIGSINIHSCGCFKLTCWPVWCARTKDIETKHNDVPVSQIILLFSTFHCSRIAEQWLAHR